MNLGSCLAHSPGRVNVIFSSPIMQRFHRTWFEKSYSRERRAAGVEGALILVSQCLRNESVTLIFKLKRILELPRSKPSFYCQENRVSGAKRVVQPHASPRGRVWGSRDPLHPGPRPAPFYPPASSRKLRLSVVCFARGSLQGRASVKPAGRQATGESRSHQGERPECKQVWSVQRPGLERNHVPVSQAREAASPVPAPS